LFQFWDARSPNSVRSALGFFVCGEGLAFDRRGKELAVASWRPNNQLQVIALSVADYSKTR
jgi:hypothetical protein